MRPRRPRRRSRRRHKGGPPRGRRHSPCSTTSRAQRIAVAIGKPTSSAAFRRESPEATADKSRARFSLRASSIGNGRSRRIRVAVAGRAPSPTFRAQRAAVATLTPSLTAAARRERPSATSASNCSRRPRRSRLGSPVYRRAVSRQTLKRAATSEAEAPSRAAANIAARLSGESLPLRRLVKPARFVQRIAVAALTPSCVAISRHDSPLSIRASSSPSFCERWL
jgi:hypothetical protein